VPAHPRCVQCEIRLLLVMEKKVEVEIQVEATKRGLEMVGGIASSDWKNAMPKTLEAAGVVVVVKAIKVKAVVVVKVQEDRPRRIRMLMMIVTFLSLCETRAEVGIRNLSCRFLAAPRVAPPKDLWNRKVKVKEVAAADDPAAVATDRQSAC
jgi:hypothetical protein